MSHQPEIFDQGVAVITPPLPSAVAVAPSAEAADQGLQAANAPPRKPLNSTDVERAVVSLFGYRKHVIVANASWGANIHECDLLLLTQSDYGIEVEVKVSRGDIIADKKKKHHRFHNNSKIKRLYFAIPAKLNTPEIISHIPEHAGIIVVSHGKFHYSNNIAEIVRDDQPNKTARPWTLAEKYDLARLGAMRYWYRCVSDRTESPQRSEDSEGERGGEERAETPNKVFGEITYLKEEEPNKFA